MRDQALTVAPALLRDAAPAGNGARVTPRRMLMAGGLAAALLAGSWYGHAWWTHGRFVESTDDAYVGGDVTVIAPKVPGFIAQVLVTDNQAVRAGDLLIRLDDRDYRAALARADAGVAEQTATLSNLAASRALQQARVAEAQAMLASTQAEIDRSRADMWRYQALQADRWASQQRFQQADAEFRKAQAADQSARAALVAATRALDVIDTQAGQTRARLAAALAERDLARLNLDYTELRAPIDGVIGNRSGRAGAYAITGAELLSVVPSKGLWVDANFKENQLAAMRPGLPASVTADVLPGRVFPGHVASLAPATGAQFSVLPPENATGNFTKIVQRVPVRIVLDGDGSILGRLRPGLSVIARVDGSPQAAQTGGKAP
jgi:membrane fusion protein (multidrug efflux system)